MFPSLFIPKLQGFRNKIMKKLCMTKIIVGLFLNVISDNWKYNSFTLIDYLLLSLINIFSYWNLLLLKVLYVYPTGKNNDSDDKMLQWS